MREKFDSKETDTTKLNIVIDTNRDDAYEGGYEIRYAVAEKNGNVLFWRGFDCTEDIIVSELTRLQSLGFCVDECEHELF